ncbi:MAG TPA: GNAT family N-acetyltransferase [Spirochaetia bacterium]|nr:GNAT family N-acetyltransferase [Spirochaetia bacterium]
MLDVEELGYDRLEEYLSMLRERAAWLEERGFPMWDPAYLERDAFVGRYGNPACYLMKDDGQVVGGFALADRDGAWDDADGVEAWYVHKLVVRRIHAGKGYAEAALRWILDFADSRGLDAVRLDYYADRPYLARLYASCGFVALPDRVMPDGTRITPAEARPPRRR